MVVLPSTPSAFAAASTATARIVADDPAPTGPMALLLVTQGKYAGFRAWPKGYVPPNMRGDPNYKVEERWREIFIVVSVFTGLIIAMVIARLWSRWKVSRWYGSDDWWIILATVFGIGHSVDLCFAANIGGLGKHSWELTYEEVKAGVAINYPNLMLYAACMACVKNSLLCFIRRLAGTTASRKMVWAIWGLAAFVTCHAVASIIIITLWCLPVRSNWDFDARYLPNNPDTMCHDLHVWYWVSSGIHVVSDLAVLLLPIKMAWNLQISRSKKVGIIAMFSLGSIACVCSIIRMAYIIPYVSSFDITWDSWPVALFGHLETAFAIITACIPAMKPLLSRSLPGWFSSVVNSAKYHRRTSTWRTASIWENKNEHDSFLPKSPARVAVKQAALGGSPQKAKHHMSFGSIIHATSARRGNESDYDLYSVSTRLTSVYHAPPRAPAEESPRSGHYKYYFNQRNLRDNEWGVQMTEPRRCRDNDDQDRRPPVPPKDF